MPNFRKLTIATALTAVTAFPASALTIEDTSVLSGDGEVTLEDGFGFDWDNTPFTAYVDFTVDSAFDLSLERYGEDGVNTTREVSGYTLDRFDGSFDGSSERLTNETDNCADAAAPVGGACNMVGLSGNVSTPEGELINGLEAGNYRLGFYDSEEPRAGYAEFKVAPVPLPAGGALLLGALGGFAAFKRRRKSA